MGKQGLLDSHFLHYRTLIDDIFKELHGLTLEVNNKEMSDTVDNIRSRLNEPFLFVIVGEVKVGKSSFVNALLQAGREICKAAPDPCTDVIQQIVYGETASTIPINPYLKKITVPAEILKDIAIVDTPGTNTIIEHHQEITEKFIPVSDLVIFVFEAKNPYRQSAWDFLDYVNQKWRKKVIFVLQQADLVDADDLAVNLKGVRDHAIKKGIAEPKVFAVSAKRELKGEENSGFDKIRSFVAHTITGGNNIRLKIANLLTTTRNIMESIDEGIAKRKQQIEEDTSFRGNVNALLDRAEDKAGTQVDDLVRELIREYDRQTLDLKKQFEDGLGVGTLLKKSVMSLFDKSQSMEEWMKTISDSIENKLKPALERKMRNGILNISDSVRQMAEIIDTEIRKYRDIGNAHNRIFGDIAEKRQEKMDRLQQSITDLIDDETTFFNNEMLQRSAELAPGLATGGGLVALGAILVAITHVVAIDITGGALTLIGLSMAGFITTVKRKGILEEFNAEIAKGRLKLKEQAEEKLSTYVKEIKVKIDNNFLEFDTFLNEEQKSLNDIAQRFESIESKFDKVMKDLEIEVDEV